MSPAKPLAYLAAWDWAAEMARAGDDIATAPIDLVIARIRSVYRSWNRDTSVAQMRNDWDAAFGGSNVAVTCQRVSAGSVDGAWIFPPNAPEDKAILYFHGGGFRIGSVFSHRDLIARIAVASGCRVLAINYRLAPEHRFPAALDDVLAAYGWMLDRGLKSDNVAFAGDSAGGNLVLAAMLALRERGLPLPVSAVLMSPWTDLAATGISYVSRAEADPIHQRPMILALAKNYLGGQGDPCDPLVSPLYGDLAGLPPLLIQVGDRETVLDDSVMFADKARAAGIDVNLEVWDGMIHVFQMFGAELPEAHRAIESIAGFLARSLRIKAERASS
jgi:epsilon-lactone hydrolase